MSKTRGVDVEIYESKGYREQRFIGYTGENN